MTTPITTSTTANQIHNNIMAAGSRDRPPMLATGRYTQWQSRFMRYVDTKPNGEALGKCILQGPYKLSNIIIPGQLATDESPAVPERTIPETFLNITPENKAHYDVEKEVIHLILTGIRDEIYSTVDACNRVNLSTSRMSRLVCFGSLEDLLHEMESQLSDKVNEIHAEKIAGCANPLAFVAAAQQYPEPYYQAPKSHKSYAPLSKQSSSTRPHVFTRHKGKEISKPITPPFESASEEDSNLEQAQRDKEMQKNLILITGQFGNQRTVIVTGARETVDSQEKMLMCKQAEKGVPLQVEQADWLEDTDEEVDC
ncbi:hypothetical protein Tco_1088579 [Tanacetum coccineum]